MKSIIIKDLNFGYSTKKLVLKNINLEINEGEFVAILGHNGSGKSTLAKILVGLNDIHYDQNEGFANTSDINERNQTEELVSNGQVIINGLELNEENIYEIRKNIGIVFQNPDNQFVGVTVRDDIAFGLENRQMPKEKMIEVIEKYSEIVGMNKFLDHNPEQLSGGQKQRVAIASVLAFMPSIIIFDEATSMLDPLGVKEVNNVINNLKGKKTILAITHNLTEAIKADRIIVLNKGEIVLNGKPEEVFKEKEILKEAKLDILNSMKIMEGLNNIPNKEKVEEILWQLTYQK